MQNHPPLSLQPGGPNVGISIFSNSASPQTHFGTPVRGGMAPEVMGVVSERVDILTNPQMAPQSMESVTMMDLEGRLDSLDSMDCDQQTTNVPLNSEMPGFSSGLMRGVADGHMTVSDIPVSITPSPSYYQSPPPMAVAMEHTSAGRLVMRPHPHREEPHPYPPLRHSCVDGYLQASLKPREQEFSSEAMLKADSDARLNLSKSL